MADAPAARRGRPPSGAGRQDPLATARLDSHAGGARVPLGLLAGPAGARALLRPPLLRERYDRLLPARPGGLRRRDRPRPAAALDTADLRWLSPLRRRRGRDALPRQPPALAAAGA